MTVEVNDRVCKHCGSKAVVKYGTYKGVQRYYCKRCRRKFKGDDTHVGRPRKRVRITKPKPAVTEKRPRLRR